MIKIKTNLGHTECELHGSLATLCADTSGIISAIYDGIKEKSAAAAEEYKSSFSDIVRAAFDPESIKADVDKQIAENPDVVLSGLCSFLKELIDEIKEDKEDD